MKIALSANHLKRYKQICVLLWKYGRSDLVQQMGIDDSIDPAEVKAAGAGEVAPSQLADGLEAMGHLREGGTGAREPSRSASRSVFKGARPAAGQGKAVFLRRNGADRHDRTGRQDFKGGLALRSQAYRSGVAWPGSFGGVARRAAGGGQSAATGHRKADR